MSTRSRNQPLYVGNYQYKTVTSVPGQTPVTNIQDFPVSLGKVQTTTSYGNPWNSAKLRRSGANIGGAFFTGSAEWSTSGAYVPVNLQVGFSRHTYTGPIFAYTTSGPSYSSIPTFVGTLQMNAWGASGIAKALPTNPLVNMDTFLGELRDMPKMFDIASWKNRATFFRDGYRSGGKDWLNLQFGWLPFVSDIRKFFQTAANADRIIAQYVRDSGKTIRRRSTVLDESSITTSNEGSYYGKPNLDGNLYKSVGSLVKTVSTKRKVWFSGAFTYYLPDPRGPGGKAKLAEAYARKLYGLKLDPETVYNLTPWTWALDWVTNAGDVVHNWSAFSRDGLVMRYGYIMYSYEENTTYTLSKCEIYNSPFGTLSQTLTRKSKARAGATPYGFGLNTSSFTPKQWSIIGALGISRKPGAL